MDRRLDSFQLYDGPGAGKYYRRVVEAAAVAATAPVRCPRSDRGALWLHDCFWSSAARRLAAASFPIALESSAAPHRLAPDPLFPDSGRADHRHGSDPAGGD